MISQPSVIRGRSDGVDALWRRTRGADAPETYLLLFGNARIAKLAAVALEERLAAEGRDGLALVPPVRGAGFAEWAASAAPADRQRLGSWCAENLPQDAAPVLVGLDEDGLADWLRRLGLTACLGIPPATGAPAGLGMLPDGAGSHDAEGRAAGRVRLVPVSTAQELVDAVAAATSPSGLTTVACPPAAAGAEGAPTTGAAPVWLPGRRSRSTGASAPRQLLSSTPVRAGATGLAGALVFAGLSPAAAASAQTTSPDSSFPSGSALSGLKPGPGPLSLLSAMLNPRGRHHRGGINFGVLPFTSIDPGGPMIPATNPGGPPVGGISPARHHHHHRINPGGPRIPGSHYCDSTCQILKYLRGLIDPIAAREIGALPAGQNSPYGGIEQQLGNLGSDIASAASGPIIGGLPTQSATMGLPVTQTGNPPYPGWRLSVPPARVGFKVTGVS